MTKIKITPHLDGSMCKLRKTKPKKSKIAAYWRSKIGDFGIYLDWGEPSCWACGFFNSDNDLTDPKSSLEAVFHTWDKQEYLERCHVVPVALGGCSCYGNLVLLCKNCHKANPDTASVELFLRWMKNRKDYGDRRYMELKAAFDELGLELNNFNFFLFINEEFREYFRKNAVAVGTKYTDASKVATLIEWKKLYPKVELIDKLPEFVKY